MYRVMTYLLVRAGKLYAYVITHKGGRSLHMAHRCTQPYTLVYAWVYAAVHFGLVISIDRISIDQHWSDLYWSALIGSVLISIGRIICGVHTGGQKYTVCTMIVSKKNIPQTVYLSLQMMPLLSLHAYRQNHVGGNLALIKVDYGCQTGSNWFRQGKKNQYCEAVYVKSMGSLVGVLKKQETRTKKQKINSLKIKRPCFALA